MKIRTRFTAGFETVRRGNFIVCGNGTKPDDYRPRAKAGIMLDAVKLDLVARRERHCQKVPTQSITPNMMNKACL
jgi:hypothetical protein